MKTYAGQNEVFDMYSNATLATLDVMLRCAMSYENDAQIQGYEIKTFSRSPKKTGFSKLIAGC